MRRSADISSDGLYRWSLTRNWGGSESKTVCWIMLNPSTADGETDDPTLRSIIKRTQAWGYGALVVVNRFPLRTPFPRTCKKWAKNAPADVMIHNSMVINAQMRKAKFVVAAWGAADWLPEEPGVSGLYCIGANADGSPKHPLARGKHHVPTSMEPQPWPIEVKP